MEPAARLLRLLSLLQARPTWSASELADRLSVGARTVRRDVTRLRSLGYPVHTNPGEAGYTLGAGGRLPPLLLDDDEAVAIALGLRLATTAAVTGVELAAVAALAKLDQVLPDHIRERVHDLEAATIHLQNPKVDAVHAETLIVLATACRRSERIHFNYRDFAGAPSDRRVEPFQIVHTGRRWYLVARDLDRDDWRTFRVDRIASPALAGHRFELHDPPDAAAMVVEGTRLTPYRLEAKIVLELSPDEAAPQFQFWGAVVEATGDGRALVRVASNDLSQLVRYAAGLPCDFEVIEPAELRDEMRRLGKQFTARHKKVTRSQEILAASVGEDER